MTAPTRDALSSIPPMTICDNCLTPVPFLPMAARPGNPGTLCPPCEARQALTRGAEAHLHSLIYPTVLAWARHWSAAGVSADALAQALETEGLHWHPDGAAGRAVGLDGSKAVIREALAEAPHA